MTVLLLIMRNPFATHVASCHANQLSVYTSCEAMEHEQTARREVLNWADSESIINTGVNFITSSVRIVI